MTLITKSYRKLNKRLHRDSPAYGSSGHVFADRVLALSRKYGTRDILDYGCGKRTLQEALGFPIRNYDPCIREFVGCNRPAAIVVCTEVLEHIEPECLADVLADLRRVTRKAILLTVATGPSTKFLTDGRNVHLIQQPQEWWLSRLPFRQDVLEPTPGGFLFIGV